MPVKSGATGRPFRYASLLAKLAPDTLYSAGTIAEFALGIGYVRAKSPGAYHALRRIRSACAYLAKTYFPAQPDGQVTAPGQRPTGAYFGRRYIEVIARDKRIRRNRRLKAQRKQRTKKRHTR